MPQDHSFDVVSKVNLQEVRNAVQIAQKEIGTRFDFRGTSAALEFQEQEGKFLLVADHDMQLRSVTDVLTGKLAKRGVSLKSLGFGAMEQTPNGRVKQTATLQQGIPSEKAKEIARVVKELGLKVQPRIEGDQVRVTARQIDDLQAAMAGLRAKDFGLPLQFENYR